MTTYRITADYSQADPAQRIRPLNGVNKGPLRMYRYDLETEAGFAVNYWLFWRPSDLAAAMDHGANYNHVDSLSEESYRMINAAGMEVYFRLGESYHGPSYMGADEFDAASGKLLYGTAASWIVEHLAGAAGVPGAPRYPAFIEIINEPDQSGYIGPHDQPPSSDQGDGTWNSVDPEKLDRWCTDFAELYGHCVAELSARGIPPDIIGSPGVTGGGARVLAAFHDGQGPVDCTVDQLLRKLFDQDPSSLNFLAFHWYGDGAEMIPGTTALEVATGFPGEVRAISQAMHALATEFGPDLPVHVNEWNIAGLRPTPSDDVNNARTGSFGAAFVSLGLQERIRVVTESGGHLRVHGVVAGDVGGHGSSWFRV